MRPNPFRRSLRNNAKAKICAVAPPTLGEGNPLSSFSGRLINIYKAEPCNLLPRPYLKPPKLGEAHLRKQKNSKGLARQEDSKSFIEMSDPPKGVHKCVWGRRWGGLVGIQCFKAPHGFSHFVTLLPVRWSLVLRLDQNSSSRQDFLIHRRLGLWRR